MHSKIDEFLKGCLGRPGCLPLICIWYIQHWPGLADGLSCHCGVAAEPVQLLSAQRFVLKMLWEYRCKSSWNLNAGWMSLKGAGLSFPALFLQNVFLLSCISSLLTGLASCAHRCSQAHSPHHTEQPFLPLLVPLRTNSQAWIFS